MVLLTIERLSGRAIREGEVVHACAVCAANILRDFREHITNTLGGKMRRYEDLIDDTISQALTALDEKAKARGYDGVLGVRISHPSVIDGGVEVVVYGTGFNYTD